ncbi:MAG TPA: hypothetical protein ENG50_05205 [Candidatus Altiarchaeales archaeon]|nr:hypothetical protein [Candidatus Altiarchaeales archaeon]
MEAVSEEVIERGIHAVYKELGLEEAVQFLRAISGVKGDLTEEHKEMPEFSDENVKKLRCFLAS